MARINWDEFEVVEEPQTGIMPALRAYQPEIGGPILPRRESQTVMPRRQPEPQRQLEPGLPSPQSMLPRLPRPSSLTIPQPRRQEVAPPPEEDGPGVGEALGTSMADASLGLLEGVGRIPDFAGRSLQTGNRLLFRGLDLLGVDLDSDGKVPGLDRLTDPFTNAADDLAAHREHLQRTDPVRQQLAEKAQRADEVLPGLAQGDLGPLKDTLTDPAAIASFVGASAPSLAAALATGGSLPVLMGLEGLQSLNSIAEHERRTGEEVSPEDAVTSTAQTALVGGALERLGVDSLMPSPGRGLFKGMGRGALGEGSTEAAQELNANLAQRHYDPDASLTEGIVPGAIGGAGTGAAVGAVSGALAPPQEAPPGLAATRAQEAPPGLETAEEPMPARAAIDMRAHEAATSPLNERPEPTPAQKAAGNYKKGEKIPFHGLKITVENPQHSVRSGTDKDGRDWSQEMWDHYGYINRTEGKDGDQIDVFVGEKFDGTKPADAERVFVIDQEDPDTGRFDEHKVVVGADSVEEARAIYERNYQPGWQGFGGVKEFTARQFKDWLKNGGGQKRVDARKRDVRKVTGAAEEQRGVSVTGIHYGNVGGLTELDGTKFGTGHRGRETNRLAGEDPRLRARTYFYLDRGDGTLVDAEPEVTGRHVYRANLSGLYDANADPEGLVDADPTVFERNVIDRGYRGYVDRKAMGGRGAAVVFQERTPVEQLGPTPARAREVVALKAGPLAKAHPTVTAEVVPSAKTEAGAWAVQQDVTTQREFSHHVQSATVRNGEDELARRLSIPYTLREGTGAYGGGIHPNLILDTTDPDKATDYALAMKHIYQQDAVPWFRADESRADDPDAARGVSIKIDELNDAKLDEVQQQLMERLGPDVGFTQVDRDTVVVINFRGEDGPFLADDDTFLDAVADVFEGREDTVEMVQFGADSAYLGDDWDDARIEQHFAERGDPSFKWYLRDRRQAAQKAAEEFIRGRQQEPQNPGRTVGSPDLQAGRGDRPDPQGQQAAGAGRTERAEGAEGAGRAAVAEVEPFPADLTEEPSEVAAGGLSRDFVATTVHAVTAKWRGAPPVHVVQHQSELPLTDADRDRFAGKRIRGYVRSGEVWLVADNLTSKKDALETMLHEVVGHMGMRGLMGERFDRLLDDIWTSYGRQGLRVIAGTYGLDLDTVEGRREAAEEMLAHMAETADKPRVLARILSALRLWLRDHGFDIQLNDTDLRLLLSRARDHVRGGTAPARFSVVDPFSVQLRKLGQFIPTPAPAPGKKAKRPTLKEVGPFFDQHYRDTYGHQGDPNDPDDFRVAVANAADEIRFQLEQERTGEFWYEEDVTNALRATSILVPEMRDDQHLRMFMTVLAGITSQGQKAVENWGNATIILETFAKSGFTTIPIKKPSNGTQWGQGQTKPLMALQAMVKKMGGYEPVVEWLLTPHTVAEIRDLKRSLGVYSDKVAVSGKAGDIKPGIFIFGEKIGPFTLNLNGIKETTADVWFTRTFNRHFGTMTKPPGLDEDSGMAEAPRNESERAIMKRWNRAVAESVGKNEQSTQAILWYYEQQLYDAVGIRGAKSESFSDGARRVLQKRGFSPEEIERHLARDIPVSRGAEYLAGLGRDDARAVPTLEADEAGRAAIQDPDLALKKKSAPLEEIDLPTVYHGSRDPQGVLRDGYRAEPAINLRNLPEFAWRGARSGSFGEGGGVNWYSPTWAWWRALPKEARDRFQREIGEKIRTADDLGRHVALLFATTNREEAANYASVETDERGYIIGQSDPFALDPARIGGILGYYMPDINDRGETVLVLRAGANIDLRPAILGNGATAESEEERGRASVQDPDLVELKKKIGRRKKGLLERIDEFRSGLVDRVIQGFADSYRGLQVAERDVLDEDTPVEQRGYVAARMATGIPAMMDTLLLRGSLVWRNNTVHEKEGSKGLIEILRPVQDNLDDWLTYMVARRANRLMEEGREKTFTAEEIAAGLRLGERHPEFVLAAEDWAAFNHDMLDFAEAAGLIDGATRPLWEHAEYIPFYRLMDDNNVAAPRGRQGVANQSSGIKRLKGSGRAINDPLENMIMNTAHLLTASMKNHAMRLAVENLRNTPYMSPANHEFRPVLTPMSSVMRVLEDEGVEVELLDERVLGTMQKVMGIQPPSGKDVVRVMVGGRPQFYHVHDPLLFRALTSIDKVRWGKWMEAFRIPKRILTEMVTADPGFAIRNFVRDTMQAFVVARDPMVPMLSSMRSALTTFRAGVGGQMSPEQRAILASGAGFTGSGYVTSGDPKATSRELRALLATHGVSENTIIDTPRKYMHLWQRLLGSMEQANRVAVYRAAKRAGKSDLEASYEAKDFMDFSQRGDWAVIQFLAETVPFFSARIAGAYRLGRGMAENPRAFLAKGSMIMLASVALYLLYRDDERYKALEDWDRNSYYHFWLPDGSHWRLPKPFEVGAFFSTVPERATEAYLDWLAGEKGEEVAANFAKQLGWVMSETFNVGSITVPVKDVDVPVPLPQTLAPAAEVFANYDSFRRRPIVGMGEERLPAELQYDYRTSESMVELGKQLGMSPKYLEHMMNGYFGTLGNYALMAADAIVREVGDYPAKPASRPQDWPVVKSFYRGTELGHTRYGNDFYELAVEIEQAASTLRRLRKEGRFEEMREHAQENRHLLRASGVAGKMRQAIGKINKQIEQVHKDRTLSPQEKRRRLDRLEQTKQAQMRRMSQTLERITEE